MTHFFRFIDGLQKFARHHLEPEEAIALAETVLRTRVRDRDKSFLSLAERGIFGYSQSPYLPLLSARRITLPDLRKWVNNDGLEASLGRLEQEGVYFTVDEFKGKTPLQRNGITLRCNEHMFDNPFLSSAYEVRSGATRSAGTRIQVDFDYLHQRSLYDAFLLNLHDCLTAPVANWFPVFPGAPGINSILRFAHIGNPMQRWYSQVSDDQVTIHWKRRWGTMAIYAMHKHFGHPLPEPEYAGLGDAGRIARWAAAALDHHPHCVVYTFAASAVRVCNAAADENLNLNGAVFLVTGEPLTSQKKREIESAGATAVPVYGISEAGVIAAGCNRQHPQSDHCHVYKDTMAVIAHPRLVPKFDIEVSAFLFTTLLYESPKLLLNVDMGDFGDIRSADCDCCYSQVGFDTSMANIRSYEKLTGEGVSFVDTDFVQILERDLPEAFGGRSSDYQLMEAEDDRGMTRLELLVSPRVGPLNENEVIDKFMDLLRTSRASRNSWSQTGVHMWRQAGMLHIRRADPIPTVSGKILPFYMHNANFVPASA